MIKGSWPLLLRHVTEMQTHVSIIFEHQSGRSSQQQPRHHQHQHTPCRYETTANTLAFVIYMLAVHPGAEARLVQEVDAFGRSRALDTSDLDQVCVLSDLSVHPNMTSMWSACLSCSAGQHMLVRSYQTQAGSPLPCLNR